MTYHLKINRHHAIAHIFFTFFFTHPHRKDTVLIGLFVLGEVEDPPDEGEEGVKPTWVPVRTLLGVDRSMG
ncbi:MAG: hypothetical protein K940chlam9_01814 [Chlamydiae bacterium]|nr:hypothetical protein [Chlamydiota bacterium]